MVCKGALDCRERELGRSIVEVCKEDGISTVRGGHGHQCDRLTGNEATYGIRTYMIARRQQPFDLHRARFWRQDWRRMLGRRRLEGIMLLNVLEAHQMDSSCDL